jgi:protein-disulfide isomerase
VTEDGHAWIGAAQPTLTILEYSDYQCPHCRRGHDKLRTLIEAHPTEVRLVHRHYPLDQACNPKVTRAFHESACRFAAMATCAGQQDRFWEANDYLYARGATAEAVETDAFVKALGLDAVSFEACMRDDAKARVEADVQSGIAVGVQGTPTLVIDGRTSHDVPDEDLARLR